MNPVLAEVIRGGAVESRHRGAVVAKNADGKTVLSIGDTDALVFPRSSLKPLQVIPLVESGAVDKFSISESELALACASHNGEPAHMQVLLPWMKRVGLSPSQLECGPSLPLDKEASEAHLRNGGNASRELHNCSGKHTGMLTLAAFSDEPLNGYSEYNHATQQRWMSLLSVLSGVDVFSLPWDKDGCGLPAIALPLSAFAQAFTPFINAHKHSDKRHLAMARVSSAMGSHPHMVAGNNRCCTASMTGCDNLMVKVGAEGVFIAVAVEAGIVIALKNDDGATRGAEVMLGAALRQRGLISESQYLALAPWYNPAILNSQEVVVGSVQPSKYWSNL